VWLKKLDSGEMNSGLQSQGHVAPLLRRPEFIPEEVSRNPQVLERFGGEGLQ
jgi:hypothetical protein